MKDNNNILLDAMDEDSSSLQDASGDSSLSLSSSSSHAHCQIIMSNDCATEIDRQEQKEAEEEPDGKGGLRIRDDSRRLGEATKQQQLQAQQHEQEEAATAAAMTLAINALLDGSRQENDHGKTLAAKSVETTSSSSSASLDAVDEKQESTPTVRNYKSNKMDTAATTTDDNAIASAMHGNHHDAKGVKNPPPAPASLEESREEGEEENPKNMKNDAHAPSITRVINALLDQDGKDLPLRHIPTQRHHPAATTDTTTTCSNTVEYSDKENDDSAPSQQPRLLLDDAEQAKIQDEPNTTTRNHQHETTIQRQATRVISTPGAFRLSGPPAFSRQRRQQGASRQQQQQRPPILVPSEQQEEGSGNDDGDSHQNDGVTIATSPARQVPAREAVIIAEDSDTQQLRHCILRGMTCLVILAFVQIVTLSIVLTTRDKGEEIDNRDIWNDTDTALIDIDHNNKGGPKRCQSTTLSSNPALHCHCYNTTQAIWDDLLDADKLLYEHVLSVVKNATSEQDHDDNRNDDFARFQPASCAPQANSILSIVIQQKLQKQQHAGKSDLGYDESIETVVQLFHPNPNEGWNQMILARYASWMLYHSLNGLNWFNSNGWNHVNVATLFGLKETFWPGTVTAIDLNSTNLRGTIPTEIQFLSHLQTIDLSGNPGIVGTLPTQLVGISTLKTLKLSDTKIHGRIPTEIGRLTRLDTLQLHAMRLSGTIPFELFTRRLRVLDFSENDLTGTIPAAITNSLRLQSLKLQSNQLSGSLPSIKLLKELELVDLRENYFTTTAVAAESKQLPLLEFFTI